MNTSKLYSWLAAVAGLIGVGMLLGNSLGQGTASTPIWIGGILILLGAILMGMSISTQKSQPKPTKEV